MAVTIFKSPHRERRTSVWSSRFPEPTGFQPVVFQLTRFFNTFLSGSEFDFGHHMA